MFLNAMRDCNNEISSLECCGDRSPCNCENSLTEDYYHRNDSYNCQKKMDTYVIKYGPSYISEIYHYLEVSQILTRFRNSPLNIISLGCGFAPDYYAISKYNQDNQLNIQINYTGLDLSTFWNTARPNVQNCTFRQTNLTESFSLKDAHIVFICKSFSTMYKNGMHAQFLQNLTSAINQDMSPGSILVFIDVNHIGLGRDVFDDNISSAISPINKYHFKGYSELDWIIINNNNVIYNINQGLFVESIPNTNDTIIFEYRKES
ncbi:hypothetical protein SOV92_02860 [Pectobacterium brasiliense]|uniref:Class I SAM-dependent methyltransferase n=1 Tax=Pectobacterium brasiliense TaxID=180957 RepID=A0AAW9GXS9_9GAMM|nr:MULTISPECIES: hypothetical protein [Pectobacterium]KFF65370.1 hypothetical protein IW00_11985 [Pectobacterium brasiliense]MDG0805699.1 hypothetical protein [Pectobacterium brasiliense]MDY4376792.1 hypothetical protein [Pectobacterium brasiliense]